MAATRFLEEGGVDPSAFTSFRTQELDAAGENESDGSVAWSGAQTEPGYVRQPTYKLIAKETGTLHDVFVHLATSPETEMTIQGCFADEKNPAQRQSYQDELRTHLSSLADEMYKIATLETEDYDPALQYFMSDRDAHMLHDQMYLLALIVMSWDERSHFLNGSIWSKRGFSFVDKDCSGEIQLFEMRKICRIIDVHPDIVVPTMRFLQKNREANLATENPDVDRLLEEVEFPCIGKDDFARIMDVLQYDFCKRTSLFGLCSCGAAPLITEDSSVKGKALSHVDYSGFSFLVEPRKDIPVLFSQVARRMLSWLLLPLAHTCGSCINLTPVDMNDRGLAVLLCLASYVNIYVANMFKFSFFEIFQPVFFYLVVGALDIERVEVKKARRGIRQHANDVEFIGWKPRIYFYDKGEAKQAKQLDMVIKDVKTMAGFREEQVVDWCSLSSIARATVIIPSLAIAVPLVPPLWRYCFGGGRTSGDGVEAAFPGPWYATTFVIGLNVLTVVLLAKELVKLMKTLSDYIPVFDALSALVDRHKAAAAGFEYWLPLRWRINVISWSRMRSEFWADSMERIQASTTFISIVLATALLYIGALWVRTVYFQSHHFTVSDATMTLASILLLSVMFSFIYDGVQLNALLEGNAATLRTATYEFEEMRSVHSEQVSNDEISQVNEVTSIVLVQMASSMAPISLFGFPLTTAFINTIYGYATTIVFTLLQKYGMDVEGVGTDILQDTGLDKLGYKMG